MRKRLLTAFCAFVLTLILILPAWATVSSEVTRIMYDGDGAETVFAYPFKIFADADLLVVLRDADGVETTQSLTTHYTVSGAGTATGGNVTMITAPTATEELLIMRNIAATQSTDYIAGGKFPAETHEAALDRLTMLVQQLEEKLDRTPYIPKTLGTTDFEISDVTAGEYLRWNLAGDGIDSIDQVSDTGTFLQSGTGAVSRTVASKLGDIIDIRDFGAVGDSDGTTGSGTDNRTEIQAALNALTTGGTLIVPAPLIFRLSDNIYVQYDDVTITGGGRLYFDTDTFTAYDSRTCAVVVTQGGDVAQVDGNVDVQRTGTIGNKFTWDNVDMTSNGGKNGTYDSANQGFFVEGYNYVEIKNSYFAGFDGEFIRFAGVYDAKVTGNTFENLRYTAVEGYVTSHVHINNNTAINVGMFTNICGTYMEITGNVLTDMGDAAVAGGTLSGIYVSSSTYLEPHRVVIEGNYVESDPAEDTIVSAGIRIGTEGTVTTESYSDVVSVQNNTVVGGWATSILVHRMPPATDGSQVVANNHIVMFSTGNTQEAIKIDWDADSYGGNEYTEVYNNTIVHADSGKALASINVRGAGLTEPPRTRVVGNKITTMGAYRSEADGLSNHGRGSISLPLTDFANTISRDNYRDGKKIGKRVILTETGAGVADATTAGKARTSATVVMMVDHYIGSKGSTDDLFDLTGVTVAAGSYMKVLLCIDVVAGTGHIIEGTANTTSQAWAEIPQVGLAYDWIPVGVVEIPDDANGFDGTQDLAAYVFWDLIGELDF